MIRLILAILATLPIAIAPASAQSWPDKPVKIIVPFPPGGNVDAAARAIGQKLQERFGQPFVVESRPGANGVIAMNAVTRSAPDGYTLGVAPGSAMLFAHMLQGRTNVEWRNEFTPVGSISLTPNVLLVSPGLPVRNLKEFLALAKQRQLNFELGGVGSMSHFWSELMQQHAGVNWLRVTYKGSAPGIVALMGGECDFGFEPLSGTLPMIKAGRLRAISIARNSRHPQLPDVPTFAEQGFGDFAGQTFTGLFAPPKTPAAVVNRLAEGLAQALKSPDVIEQFNTVGSDVFATSTAEFATYLDNQVEKWGPLIRSGKVKVD